MVTLSNIRKSPLVDEIQLDKAPLYVRPRLSLEDGDLRGETHLVLRDSPAEHAISQLVNFHLIPHKQNPPTEAGTAVQNNGDPGRFFSNKTKL
jgi:hypothetical protein